MGPENEEIHVQYIPQLWPFTTDKMLEILLENPIKMECIIPLISSYNQLINGHNCSKVSFRVVSDIFGLCIR